MKLLIPSAKVVPYEATSIGRLPALIYPIGRDYITFDFLLRQYNRLISEIDIICYEQSKTIREKLAGYSLQQDLRFIELDHLGDVGYSVCSGLCEDDEDVIVNFSDTIIMDELPFNKPDFFCSTSGYKSNLWTFYDIQEGHIISIEDKMKPPNDSQWNKHPFFTGVFKFHHGSFFRQCLLYSQQKKTCNIDSFYDALIAYSHQYPLAVHDCKDWCDVGHAQEYYDTRMRIQPREFNYIEIDKDRGILRKTSHETSKFLGEIQWYLHLPMDVQYVRPRIFSYSLDPVSPYISMEYYSYKTLHEMLLYGNLLPAQWERVFKKIRFVLEDFARYTIQETDMKDSLRKMYLDKTLSRLEMLRDAPSFSALFSIPISVNGIKYMPLDQICKILPNIIRSYLYDVNEFQIIHGDFCFANIMIDDSLSFLKLIDPRGSFGKTGIYGDLRYDLAKLLHSIEGKYDFIIKDLFRLEIEPEAVFTLDILKPTVDPLDLVSIFTQVFHDMIIEKQTQIKLIEALLFLSMTPMHKENKRHQYAMLCRGLQLLDEAIGIRYEEAGK